MMIFFLTFMLSTCSLFDASSTCIKGQYYVSSTECLFCPVNTYCSQESGCAGSCLPCPATTLADYTGAVTCTNSQTLVCPEGTGKSKYEGCYWCESGGFNKDGNQLYCGCSGGKYYYIGNCPGGRDCMGGGNYCTMCNGGYSRTNEDLHSASYGKSCNNCPTGTSTTFDSNNVWKYQSYACTNASTISCPINSGKWPTLNGCLGCTGGSSNDKGSLYCNCGSGKYYSITGTCQSCNVNTFCTDEGTCQQTCNSCPTGTFASALNAGACTNNNTIGCPVGFGMYKSSAMYGCYKCVTPAYYSATSTFCQCPVGYEQTTDFACQSCYTGYYRNVSMSKCEKCPDGAISKMSYCELCPENTYFYNYVCANCTASKPYASKGSTICYECPMGMIKNTNGICTKCSAGKYRTTSNTCEICPFGTYSTGGQDICTACPLGTTTLNGCAFQSESGYSETCTSIASCVPCPAGSFGTTADIGKYNFQGQISGANSYNNYYSLNLAALLDNMPRLCNYCPTGKYSDKPGSIFCRSCPSTKPYTFPAKLTIRCSNCNSDTFEPSSIDACFSDPGYQIVKASKACYAYNTNSGYSKSYYDSNNTAEYSFLSSCPDKKVLLSGSCTSCGANEYFYADGKFGTIYLANCNNNINQATGYVRRVGSSMSYPKPSCVSTCPIGTVGVVELSSMGDVRYCTECSASAGQYYDTKTKKCQICPDPTYPEYDGTTECTKCPYPWQSITTDVSTDPMVKSNGYIKCDAGNSGFCLCLNDSAVISIIILIAFTFIISLFVFYKVAAVEIPQEEEEKLSPMWIQLKKYEKIICLVLFYAGTFVFSDCFYVIKLLLLQGIPLSDWLTDLAFLISNKFYNWILFMVMLILFLLNALLFIGVLFQKKAVPKFYILAMPHLFVFENYDSLTKIFITFFVSIPYGLANSPALVPWFLIGVLFYTTKVFAIRSIQKFWLSVWSDQWSIRVIDDIVQEIVADDVETTKDVEVTNDVNMNEFIDSKVLNESIFFHLVIETVPILVVQFVNNTLYQSWTPLGYFSIASSCFNAINGCYRVGYYMIWHGYALSEIPVELAFSSKKSVKKEITMENISSSRFKDLEPLLRNFEKKIEKLACIKEE